MRFIIVLAISFFAHIHLFGQQSINFETTDWKEALVKAERENKFIFVDAYAIWCGPCKWMDKHVFTNRKVAAFYNANFINVKLDMDEEKNKELFRDYTNILPTYLFFRPDGELVFRTEGSMPANKFLSIAGDVLNLPYDEDVAEELKYSDLLKYIDSEVVQGKNRIEIMDKLIYWEKDKTGEYLINPAMNPINGFPDRFPGISFSFIDCDFRMNMVLAGDAENIGTLKFTRCAFYDRFLLANYSLSYLPSFINCSFGSVDLLFNYRPKDIDWYSVPVLSINDCSISKYLNIVISGPDEKNLNINNTIFGNDESGGLLNVVTQSFQNISIDGTEFLGDSSIVYLEVKNVDQLSIRNSMMNTLVLNDVKINDRFDLINSTIRSNLAFNRSSLPEIAASNISWGGNHLKGKLVLYDEGSHFWANRDNRYKIFGAKDSIVISDNLYFSELVNVYSMFIDLYKGRKDIDSYNSAYSEFKNINLSRLKHLYRSDPSFKNLIQWRLNSLLKFYVDHGTDPGRAIIISIYCILIFGVFYFFFPSDWDVNSKSMLIKNFSDFVQKNEKGYITPFLALISGFFISLLNAVTLSLNSFITLGFGNIPTSGIARYVCIVEGFIGWFLLTLFTASLINQLLI